MIAVFRGIILFTRCKPDVSIHDTMQSSALASQIPYCYTLLNPTMILFRALLSTEELRSGINTILRLKYQKFLNKHVYCLCPGLTHNTHIKSGSCTGSSSVIVTACRTMDPGAVRWMGKRSQYSVVSSQSQSWRNDCIYMLCLPSLSPVQWSEAD